MGTDEGKRSQRFWSGFAEISGAFASESTIAWPKVTSQDAGNGRALVKIAPGDSSYRHKARYLFLKHGSIFLSADRPRAVGVWSSRGGSASPPVTNSNER